MAFELIRPKPTYTIKGTPAGAIEVSLSSEKQFSAPQAFDFAREQGGRLQTIGEALIARVAFYEANKKDNSGFDHSDEYQRTSTVSLKFKNDGKFDVDAPYVIAFVDLPTDEKSKALVQEGFDANIKGNELIKPVKDAFICDLIKKAEAAGRIAPAIATIPFKLPTEQVKGKSEYGKHQMVSAVFGNPKLGELNANYLKERGYDFGKIWDLTQKELEKMIKEDEALVRAVGFGNYYNTNDVDADDDFDDDGHARSVVHGGAQKTSSKT